MNLLDLFSLQFLSGPAFLMTYAPAVIGSYFAGRSFSNRLTLADRTRYQRDPLTPSQLAFMEGGSQRALLACLVHLEAQGALSVIREVPAQIQTQHRPAQATALENAVLQAAAVQTTFPTLFRDPGVQQQLQALEAELIDMDYLIGGSKRQAALQQGTLVYGAVLAVGATRWWIGLLNGRPVLYLSVLMAVVFGFFLKFRSSLPKRTAHAEQYLREQQKQWAALRETASSNAGSLSPHDQTVALALFGTAALLPALFPVVPSGGGSCSSFSTSSCSSSSSSCSSSSCGSSCGGGGCGGGGCGG